MIDPEKSTYFEYDGLWLHATPEYSKNWKEKGYYLFPPIEDFHKQMIILRQLELWDSMNFAGELFYIIPFLKNFKRNLKT